MEEDHIGHVRLIWLWKVTMKFNIIALISFSFLVISQVAVGGGSSSSSKGISISVDD